MKPFIVIIIIAICIAIAYWLLNKNKKGAPFTSIDIIATIQLLREKLEYEENEEIFENACNIAYSLPQKEINKVYRKEKVSKEYLALNIIQNSAMIELNNATLADCISGRSSAKSIYDDVNKMKLEKKYISKQQYDENKELAIYLVAKNETPSVFR